MKQRRLVVLVACGAEPLPITSCTAGVQTACTCPGGSTGAQRCAADGSGFGECMCSSADAAVDVVAVADAQPDAPTPDMVTVDRPDVVAVGDGPVVDVPSACVDRDGDGYGAGCARGPDCDDNDPLSHPGAPERCDGFDNDIVDRVCAVPNQDQLGVIAKAFQQLGEQMQRECDEAEDAECAAEQHRSERERG